MQKEGRLEDFGYFRTTKRQKTRRSEPKSEQRSRQRSEQRNNLGEDVETQNCLCEKNSNEKPSNQACN